MIKIIFCLFAIVLLYNGCCKCKQFNTAAEEILALNNKSIESQSIKYESILYALDSLSKYVKFSHGLLSIETLDTNSYFSQLKSFLRSIGIEKISKNTLHGAHDNPSISLYPNDNWRQDIEDCCNSPIFYKLIYVSSGKNLSMNGQGISIFKLRDHLFIRVKGNSM